MDIPDISLVEHVKERVKGRIGFKKIEWVSKHEFVIFERRSDE